MRGCSNWCSAGWRHDPNPAAEVTLSLSEAAHLAGGHRWVESRLFELLGGWVGSTPEPGAKLLFDRHSQHHAWRAGQWWDRLPVLADIDREALVVAPSAGVAGSFGALAQLEGTPARLAGAYRFALPRLVGSYDRHLAAAHAVSDGAALRTLGIVAADAAADWREGEAVLQDLLVDQASVRASAETVAALEALLL